jgi:hypothetical protein
MITFFLVPFENTPQIFQITFGSTQYFLNVRWNDADDAGWIMDIQDSNQNPLACNIPFITGADLLDGLEYLGIEGVLYVITAGDMPLNVPTLQNLGIDCSVYFGTSVPNAA